MIFCALSCPNAAMRGINMFELTSIIVFHIRQVVATTVMGFSDRGRVVGEEDITIVTIVFLE